LFLEGGNGLQIGLEAATGLARLEGGASDLGSSKCLAASFESRQAYLPEDFPERLERLKQATGLSWEGVAMCLGVDVRQVQRWRRGTEPCGGALFALFRLADRIPDGLDLLLREDAGQSRAS